MHCIEEEKKNITKNKKKEGKIKKSTKTSKKDQENNKNYKEIFKKLLFYQFNCSKKF